MPQLTNANLQILFLAAQKLKLHPQIISSPAPALQISSKTKTHLITAKSFGLNSTKSINLSRNKSKTIKILQEHHLPTPMQTVIYSLKNYPSACKKIPFPQVIKPLTGQKGKLVFLNIKNIAAGQTAGQQILARHPDGCLIESYHPGHDYRFLVLNFKVIGLVQRLAPVITGNGRSTIKQLIDQENSRRLQLWQTTGRRMLNRLRNWPRLSWYLSLQGLSLQAVLPQGKTVTLYPIPNFSIGGSVIAIDPAAIHPDLIKLVETAAKIINLTLCGIDMIISISTPGLVYSRQIRNKPIIIEINSDPGLRLHDWPNQGKPQHVAETILNYISTGLPAQTGINSKLS